MEEKESERSGLLLMEENIGKFLEDFIVDEVVFGNIFERLIKDSLLWGISVVIKFM